MAFRQSSSRTFEVVAGELLNKFGIPPEDAAAMRYVSMEGRLGSGHVNRVCIFNPSMLSAPAMAGATYEGLMTLRKGLLFTGHIMKSPEAQTASVVLLNDQRSV